MGAKRILGSGTKREMVRYVEEQLGCPNYRTLNDVTGDFCKEDPETYERKPITMNQLKDALRHAERGCIIEYVPCGALVRHKPFHKSEVEKDIDSTDNEAEEEDA